MDPASVKPGAGAGTGAGAGAGVSAGDNANAGAPPEDASGAPSSVTPAYAYKPTSPPRSSSLGRLLTLGGALALGGGYLVAVIAGGVGTGIAASQQSQNGSGGTCSGGSSLSFIPLIGPFMTLGTYPNHDIIVYGGTNELYDCNSYKGIVTGIVVTDEVLQIGGAAMLAAGLILNATLTQSKSGSLSLFPGASGTPLGLTLGFTNF